MVERIMGLMNVGEEWVLWLLIILSIIMIALMIERTYVIIRRMGNVKEYRARLNKFIWEGNLEGAKKYFEENPTSPARIVTAALASINRSPEAMLEMIEAETVEQRMVLERGFDFLGSLGSNAPFIGLFGTVLGIIQAFQALASAQTAEPQVVMAGISASLVATAAGLAVAIPALVAFNVFKGMTRDIFRGTEQLCKAILSYSLDQHLGKPVSATDKVQKFLDKDEKKEG